MIGFISLLTVSLALIAPLEARGRMPSIFIGGSGISSDSRQSPFSFLQNEQFLSGTPFFSIMRRPRYFFMPTEAYHPWTNWTNCRAKSCRRFRYRKCKGGIHRCSHEYLVEMKKCKDAPGCQDEVFNVTMEKSVTDNCGRRPPMNLKILGGRTARPNSWPWQASLILKTGRSQPACGATLIGSRWVVTAAHCLVVANWPSRLPIGKSFRPRFSLQVRLGDHDTRRHDTHEDIYNVASVVIHPEFKLEMGSCLNDLALLKLDRAVNLHQHVNVACLPSDSMSLPPAWKCTALGWGVYRTKKRTGSSFFDFFRPAAQVISPVLQEVEIPLISHRDCRREYPEFSLRQKMHICAGEPGKDTCKGDSGGPLMCAINVNGTQRWFLYGVTSFGSQSGCGRTYGVYSRVSAFSKWITEMQKRI